ncbi:hypothetical protein BDB00DRAFT_805150 [Zychaea mexicana]|uniref:uncharacterized protein n=1 Tax=Zychaea mexicana TaxID=64656 RepID=UPI0022FE693F|nr:uncharacterized protein BDB00DRAFT_805150 [Zychaea mexicana]KAI9497146.1 hypothetical protein BDB00DRAFT_805150 [Zychaea mexicana]
MMRRYNTHITYVVFFLMTLAVNMAEAQHGGNSETTSSKHHHGHTPTFSENTILTSGTLFYIAISISFGLWCTGFGLEFAMDRHEKQANARAFQKYTQSY